jgi:hypothetical protein
MPLKTMKITIKTNYYKLMCTAVIHLLSAREQFIVFDIWQKEEYFI